MGILTHNSPKYRWVIDHINYDKPECLYWPFAYNSSGYVHFKPYPNVFQTVTNFYCIMKHGKVDLDKSCVLHSCGNRKCLNPKHLYWGDYIDNQNDRLWHNQGTKTLSFDAIKEIYMTTGYTTYLMQKYNISRMEISRIRGGLRCQNYTQTLDK